MGIGKATKHQLATIPSGGSLSGGVLIGDMVISGLLMPPAWDAASISFQVSHDDGVTWTSYYDSSGTEQTLSPAAPAGKYLAVDPSMFAGITFVKIRSGTAGAPVNQTANRAVTVVSRKYYALS